ncbi:hypothetical protein SGPA1_21733 [Streptomyces misionensis JCM 4497]
MPLRKTSSNAFSMVGHNRSKVAAWEKKGIGSAVPGVAGGTPPARARSCPLEGNSHPPRRFCGLTGNASRTSRRRRKERIIFTLCG